jgi:flagellar protein FliL
LSVTITGMSSSPPPKTDATEEKPAEKAGKGKLMILIAGPVVLLLAGAGLWFTGILPHLLGMDRHEEKVSETAKQVPPSYLDIPEMIANLNNNMHKVAYVKLSARVEIPKPEDVEKVKAALPRLQDMMQTYLREMRPEELRGSAGTYRLREELLVRANVAVAPAKISDVLFTQMLVQ